MEINPEEVDWHRLSAHSEGIKFHIGTTDYTTAILHVFCDVDALNLKRRCFHPTGIFCNCVTASSNRMTSQANAMSPEEMAMLAIKAARALECA